MIAYLKQPYLYEYIICFLHYVMVIRWLLILLCAQWSKSGNSICWGIGYLERVNKSDFFFGMDLFYIIRASHIITMALCNYLYLIIWLYHPIDDQLNIFTCVLRYRSIGYHNLKANMSIRKQTVWALYSYSWLTRKVLL